MASQLKDPRLFLRFFFVNGLGTIVDIAVALVLAGLFNIAELIAATIGFLAGTSINYVAHTLFSYEHTTAQDLSLAGYCKYVSAVLASLVVRLVVLAVLGGIVTLPFSLDLIIAIGASFIASYVIATLWVFRKPDE